MPAAFRILDYLVSHPEAQDTVEGIAEWWLLEQHIRRVSGEVKQAMVELAAKGFVLERRGEDGRVCYRLNPRKRAEVAQLLREVSAHTPEVACDSNFGDVRRRR